MRSSVTPEMRDFIEGVTPWAQYCQVKYNVLASLTIAQAILESGWGRSKLAQEANNLFGIKGVYRGMSLVVESKEWIDGEETMVASTFRAYPSKRASIIDHAEFLQKPRYAKVLKARTPEDACAAIQAAGYATEPGYGDYLLNLIGKYELDAYDVLMECPFARYITKQRAGELRA